MDIAQLIDVADQTRASRALGAMAEGEGGDDFAFARSYDLAPGGDQPPDKADPGVQTESGLADPAAFGLMMILPNTPAAAGPLPDMLTGPAPVAAAADTTAARSADVLAQPIDPDRPAGHRMATAAETLAELNPMADLNGPAEAEPAAADGEARPESPGAKASEWTAPFVGAQSGVTPADPAQETAATSPQALAVTTAGQPQRQPDLAAAKAVMPVAAANPHDAAALSASPEPDTGSGTRRLTDDNRADGRTATEEGREPPPEADNPPVAEPKQNRTAEGGADGNGGDRTMGEWVATVTQAKGQDDPSGTRLAEFSVQGRGHPQIAQEIGRQLSEAMTGMPDRPVEIALSPEELGRVRMVIATTDGTVSLQVIAERPETVELMRRHADLLAQDLRQLGFDQLDLRFSGQSDGRAGEGPARQPDQFAAFRTSNEGDAIASPVARSERSGSTAAASGRSLDIRL